MKTLTILLVFAALLPVQAVMAEDKTNNTVAKEVAKKEVKSKKKKKKRSASCIHMSRKTLNNRAKPYKASIEKYAKRYGVDANLVRSVMAVESCYRRTAQSHKNAQGLMQLIPATAERFGVTDSFNFDQNIRGGTKYLKFLKARFKGDLIKTLAAYNAGEGAVDKYRGVPPYKETQGYVKKVMHVYAKLNGQPVGKFKLAKAANFVDPRFSYNKKGRVVSSFQSPFSKGKPGRSGLMMNKLKAPHLYKK